MRVRGSAGEPLPTVWDSLAAHKAHFRRGQLSLVVAGAGTGKSAFTLNYAVRAKVPTMYFSADSDSFTQLTRAISIATGIQMDDSEEMVLAEDLSVDAINALTGLPIRFRYDANPTIDSLERSLESYEELYGDYPSLIVVDNITNVQNDMADSADPFAGLEALLDYLHTMARDTQAHVSGLHHVVGEYADGNKPIPQSGVKGKISRVPELILTLHKLPEDAYSVPRIGVSPVKVRGAKFDSSGNTFAELEFIGDRMLIRDPEDTFSGTEMRRMQEEGW